MYPRRQLQEEFLNVFNVIVQVIKKNKNKKRQRTNARGHSIDVSEDCFVYHCDCRVCACRRGVDFIDNYLQCSVSCRHFCPRYTPRVTWSHVEAQRASAAFSAIRLSGFRFVFEHCAILLRSSPQCYVGDVARERRLENKNDLQMI